MLFYLIDCVRLRAGMKARPYTVVSLRAGMETRPYRFNIGRSLFSSCKISG